MCRLSYHQGIRETEVDSQSHQLLQPLALIDPDVVFLGIVAKDVSDETSE
jgi:hypothetical protein